jgi:thiosulfate/3-mercaptopyruvate sulfurtransferase
MPFKNQHKLLSPVELKNLINDSKYQSNKKLIMVFVGLGKQSEYKHGFIPGSMYLDINLIENGPFWNLVSNEQLEKVINKLGISNETTVIVYGNKIMAATRAALAFMYAGLEDVRLLNGGINAWKAFGYSFEEHPSNIQECKGNFKLFQPKTNYLSTRNDLEKNMHDKDTIVVDVRSWNEFSGKTTGYAYMKEKGRIPNAVWGYAGSDPHHMEDYEENGVLKDLDIIEKLWRESGITSEKKVVFYCGTGWRASEAFFIAHLLGWPNISVYDGGWMEWSHPINNASSID